MINRLWRVGTPLNKVERHFPLPYSTPALIKFFDLGIECGGNLVRDLIANWLQTHSSVSRLNCAELVCWLYEDGEISMNVL